MDSDSIEKKDDFKAIIAGINNSAKQFSRKSNEFGLSEELIKASEEKYLTIVEEIVHLSEDQLKKQNDNKSNLRIDLFSFFKVLIIVQLVALGVIILINMFSSRQMQTGAMVSLIASVFTETLGAIIVMVKFAFDSEQEVTILEIINGVVEKFQKYSN